MKIESRGSHPELDSINDVAFGFVFIWEKRFFIKTSIKKISGNISYGKHICIDLSDGRVCYFRPNTLVQVANAKLMIER